MTATTPSRRDSSLVPLSDRIRWTVLARSVVYALAFGAWWVLPTARAVDDARLPAVVLLSAAAVAITQLGGRLRRRFALLILGVGLCADGVVLAWYFHVLSGVAGPVPYLIVLHVAAITLLTSFRSGLKIAVWHCLTTLMVVDLESVGLLATRKAVSLGSPQVILYVCLVWGTAVIVAFLAAANERELRRRRYDAEVLRYLAVRLDAARDVDAILDVITRFVVDELTARRAAAAVVLPNGALRFQRVDARQADQMRAGVVRGELPPAGRPLLDRELSTPDLRAFDTLDRRFDPWLDDVMPDPQGVITLPLLVGQRVAGVLMFELPHRSAVHLHPIERRLAATAEQVAAHAALAADRARLVAQLRELADTDGLTKLPNRQRFDRAFDDAVSTAAEEGTQVAVMILDLDHFKQLNDTYGHQAGDEALRTAASAMSASIRGSDLVARYGGEEFVALLPNTDENDAWRVAARMREAVRENCRDWHVTVSIGIALYPVDGASTTSVLASADAALYQAKEKGRDRVIRAGTPSVPVPRS